MIDALAITRWTHAQKRARREYAAHPTACADWCIECVHPAGTTDCEHCKATRRARNYRAKKRAERRAK